MDEIKTQEETGSPEYIQSVKKKAAEKGQLAKGYNSPEKEYVTAQSLWFLTHLEMIDHEQLSQITTPEELIKALNSTLEEGEPKFVGPGDTFSQETQIVDPTKGGTVKTTTYRVFKIYSPETKVPRKELQDRLFIPGTNLWDHSPTSLNVRFIPGVYLLTI